MAENNLILLIDDNPDDVALTLRAFQKSELEPEIQVAFDGLDALDFLFARGEFEGRNPRIMPVMILLDMKMPKLDGLEVLRRLRADERTRLIPVVMLTTSKEPDDVRTSYRLGANSYILKPIDFLRFTATIQQVGSYWLELNEAPPN
jgi:two-component system, response regulator